jgi:hypothetical protein
MYNIKTLFKIFRNCSLNDVNSLYICCFFIILDILYYDLTTHLFFDYLMFIMILLVTKQITQIQIMNI